MDKVEKVRCAIYTRKSTEPIDHEFNSLDAQYEVAENYIISQKYKGWVIVPERYDDGGFSGGNTDRPALQRLMSDVKAGKIDIIVVYKLDRLSRSLLDFMKMAEFLEQHNVSFVSVTQDINTSTSAGRMMLNILMTFSEYERDVLRERVLDKIAGAKKRGKYCGGAPILGYDSDAVTKKIQINEDEAKIIRLAFDLYLQYGSPKQVALELNKMGYKTKSWTSRKGVYHAGGKFAIAGLKYIFQNPMYIGKVKHHDKIYEGEHEAIIDMATWEAAQKLVAYNRVAKYESRSALHSSFKGLLRCGYCGHSLMLTYTSKKAKRYYYYICYQHEAEAENNCPIVRVPCGDIEKIILHELSKFFKTPQVVMATGDKVNEMQPEIAAPEIVEAFDMIDMLWDKLFPGEQTRLARLLISNVVVFCDQLHINIEKEGFETLLKELKIDNEVKLYHSGDDFVTLTVPVKIQRRHGRKIIVAPDQKNVGRKPTAMAKRLALSHKWNRMLLDGEADSIKELAAMLKQQRSYVGHTLKLALLAPELQRAILSGEGPEGLNTLTLKQSIPDNWQEQREMFELKQEVAYM